MDKTTTTDKPEWLKQAEWVISSTINQWRQYQGYVLRRETISKAIPTDAEVAEMRACQLRIWADFIGSINHG